MIQRPYPRHCNGKTRVFSWQTIQLAQTGRCSPLRVESHPAPFTWQDSSDSVFFEGDLPSHPSSPPSSRWPNGPDLPPYDSTTGSELSAALLRVLHLVENSTVQSFQEEEMELLHRLNTLMHYDCPSCSPSSFRSRSVDTPKQSPDMMRRTSTGAPRHCTLKDLKQLARGPFKYQKLVTNDMLPEVLLAIALDLFCSTHTYDDLAMMVATHLPPLLAADNCTVFCRDDEWLLDIHSKRRHSVVGIIGFVAMAGTIVRAGSHLRMEKFDENIDVPAVSTLALPIFGKQSHTLAVLRIVRTRQHAIPFTEEDEHLAEIVACFLSYCLQYLGAVRERNAEGEKNRMLLQAAEALASAEYDCDKVCTQVLDSARLLCSADRCSLFLVDQARGELEAHFGDHCVVRMPVDQGIAGHVALTAEYVNISDAYSDPRFNRNVDIQTGYRTRSILCMPIQFEGKTVAVAQLVNKVERGQVVAFTQRDVNSFSSFAGYAAASLRNMRLFQIANHEYQRSESMLALTYTLASAALDVQELATRVINSAKEVTGSDRCSLFIVNEKKGQLEAHFEDMCTLLMPIDEGIAGHVAMTGESVNLADVYTDPRFNQNVDAHTGYRTKSLLCMPVMCGDSIVAVAQLVNKMEGKQVVPFTAIDEDTFLGFAVYAGVCIRTAILYNNSKKQQETADLLLDLTRTLQDHVLSQGNQLVRVLMERAQAMTKADRCVIFLVNEDGKLELPDGTDHLSHRNLAQHVMNSKSSIMLENVNEDRRFKPEGESDIQSVLCMPIVYEKNIVAVTQLINKKDPNGETIPFEEDDETLVKHFSPYAGVALRIGKLYNHATHERQRSQLILKLAHKLASVGLEEASIIAQIMEEAPALGNAEHCQLFLLTANEKDRLHPRSLRCYFSPNSMVVVSVNNGHLTALHNIARHVMQVEDAVFITDASQDSDLNHALASHIDYAMKNIMGVPIKLRDETLGSLLLINRKEEKMFISEDAELVASFVEFACMALSNCHAAQEIHKQKHLYNMQARILGKLSSTPIKDGVKVTESVMEGAKELLCADRCTVFVVDKENQQLVSKVAQNVVEEIRVSWSHGIAGKVVQTGEVYNIEDAYQNPNFNREVDLQIGYHTKSVLAMPIWHDGEIIGVTQVINKLNAPVFTAEDEELLASFSMYAGIALGNLRLYEFVVKAGMEATNLLSMQQQEIPRDNRETRTSLFRKFTAANLKHARRCCNITVEPKLLAHAKTMDFNPLEWYQRGEPGSDERLTLVRILAHLFEDMGVIETFGLDMKILVQFLMQIQAMYRNVHYHNFAHAFDVTHFLYISMRCIGEQAGLSVLDKFAMLVAGVIHDVDHMGLNNSFHLKCDTPMGILSSTAGTPSVLEVHHLNLAIQVLSIPEYNVFQCLNPADLKYVYQLLVNVVLATDMANHGKLSSLMEESVGTGNVAKELLLKMLLKTADLSNTVKPFHIAVEWAKRVTEEFYTQGDLEKQQGHEVMAMFDRQKSGELAKGQLGFIDFVAKKHMSIMASYSPQLQWLLDNVMENRQKWEAYLDPSPSVQ